MSEDIKRKYMHPPNVWLNISEKWCAFCRNQQAPNAAYLLSLPEVDLDFEHSLYILYRV